MNELERQTLLYIGEDPDSPDVFSEQNIAPIRDSINDAVQETIMLTGAHKTTYHLPLIQGRGFYRLRPKTGYLGWITDAWLVGQQRRLAQTDWIKLNHWDPRWMTMTGTPDAYLQVGLDVLGFVPRPSATSDIVALTIVEIPQAYTHDRAPIRVRRDFRLALVQYAMTEYWAGRGDARSASEAFQTYRELIGIRRDQPRHADMVAQLDTGKDPFPAEGQKAPL
jgi:hypothetical protein